MRSHVWSQWVGLPAKTAFSMRRSLRLILLAISLAVSRQAAAESWVSELRRYDQEAATIGHRLALAAREYCVNTAPALGLSVDALERYDLEDRALAQDELGLGGAVQISAVVPGGAASRAGVVAGDNLISIAGEAIGQGAPGAASYARTDAVLVALRTASDAEFLELGFRRGNTDFVTRLTSDLGCDIEWIVSTRSSRSTFTDGHAVDLPVGLFRFARSDGEIAFVAAHELAHAIFRQQGKRPRSLSGKRELEHSADALGVVLLMQAGFPPRDAAIFWTRFARADKLGFLRSADHPSTKDRIRRIEALIDEIDRGARPQDIAERLIMRVDRLQ